MRKVRTIKKHDVRSKVIQAEHAANVSGLRYQNEGSMSFEKQMAFSMRKPNKDFKR